MVWSNFCSDFSTSVVVKDENYISIPACIHAYSGLHAGTKGIQG